MNETDDVLLERMPADAPTLTPNCGRCGDSGLTCRQCGRGYGGLTPCRCSIRGNPGSATDCACLEAACRAQKEAES